MKNTTKSMLINKRTVISIEPDEYIDILKSIFGDDITIDYDNGNLLVVYNNIDEIIEEYEIEQQLAAYFDVNACSIAYEPSGEGDICWVHILI